MSSATQTATKPVDETYNPHSTFVIVNPNQPPEPGKLDFLPVQGSAFTIRPGRDGTTPFVFLDVPAYLRQHLADYREGWKDWLEEWERLPDWGALAYFNDYSDGPPPSDPTIDLPGDVAAYLGAWLWQRLVVDVVTQHGGKPEDYQVSFAWTPWMANHVAVIVPEVDPRMALPDNHPLVTHPAQGELLPRSIAGEAG